MSGFHIGSGLFFERFPNGDVRITVNDGNECNASFTFDADSWASAVASVSVRGDTAEVWQEARDLHNKLPEPT
jgi:hypothetical protein